MSSELLNLTLGITSIVTTITLVVTLGIIAWQTVQSAKQTKLNTIISYHQYYKDVDAILLQNEATAQRVFGYKSKEEAMADIMLLTFELTFQLHKEHLTDDLLWKSDVACIARSMEQEFMRRYWDEIKHTYHQEFVQFIEEKLRELGREKQNLPKVSQPRQPVPGSADEMSKNR